MSGLDGDPSQVKGADLPMQSEIALAQDSCCSIEDLMIELLPIVWTVSGMI